MTFVPARRSRTCSKVALPPVATVGQQRDPTATAPPRSTAAPRASRRLLHLGPRLRPRVARHRGHQRRRRPRGATYASSPHLRGALAVRPHRPRARRPSAHGECDTGVVQIDSLRLDATATVARGRRLLPRLRQASVERRGRRAPAQRRPPRGRRHPAARLRGRRRAPACPRSPSATSPGTGSTRATGAARRMPRISVPTIRTRVRDARRRRGCACRCMAASRGSTASSATSLRRAARAARSAPRCARALGLPATGPLVLLSFGGYGVARPRLPRCRD